MDYVIKYKKRTKKKVRVTHDYYDQWCKRRVEKLAGIELEDGCILSKFFYQPYTTRPIPRTFAESMEPFDHPKDEILEKYRELLTTLYPNRRYSTRTHLSSTKTKISGLECGVSENDAHNEKALADPKGPTERFTANDLNVSRLHESEQTTTQQPELGSDVGIEHDVEDKEDEMEFAVRVDDGDGCQSDFVLSDTFFDSTDDEMLFNVQKESGLTDSKAPTKGFSANDRNVLWHYESVQTDDELCTNVFMPNLVKRGQREIEYHKWDRSKRYMTEHFSGDIGDPSFVDENVSISFVDEQSNGQIKCEDEWQTKDPDGELGKQLHVDELKSSLYPVQMDSLERSDYDDGIYQSHKQSKDAVVNRVVISATGSNEADHLGTKPILDNFFVTDTNVIPPVTIISKEVNGVTRINRNSSNVERIDSPAGRGQCHVNKPELGSAIEIHADISSTFPRMQKVRNAEVAFSFVDENGTETWTFKDGGFVVTAENLTEKTDHLVSSKVDVKYAEPKTMSIACDIVEPRTVNELEEISVSQIDGRNHWDEDDDLFLSIDA